MSDSRAVLSEVANLAAEHGWTRVTNYIAGLDQADQRAILVAAAPDVNADAFATWLSGQAHAARVSVTGLNALAADPGPALAAGRVVITLRCGDLLMPDTIAGASAVLGRPAGSYVIVVTEAERIRTETDLAAVRRIVDGGLLNQTGTGTGRNWMFWTMQAVPGFLARQVDEDVASLSRWLSSDIDGQPELAVQRAAYALALARDADAADAAARREAATYPVTQAGRHARQLPALRASVTGLRARVLGHLDAQSQSLKREVTASLDTLRHDLLGDITAQATGRDPGSLTTLVSQRESRWTEETSRLIMKRQAQSARQATDMLDVIDWSLVNEITQASAGIRYPEPISATFPAQPVMLTRTTGFAAPTVPPTVPPAAQTSGSSWNPALRSAAVGGVVTAAAVAVLTGGVALAPIIGAAAIGVAAGTLAGAPIGQLTGRRQAPTDAVKAAVSDGISRLHATLISELDDRAATVQRAADARFADLEHTLAAAEKETAWQDPASAQQLAPAPDISAGDQLARLRARLAAAATDQETSVDIPPAWN